MFKLDTPPTITAGKRHDEEQEDQIVDDAYI